MKCLSFSSKDVKCAGSTLIGLRASAAVSSLYIPVKKTENTSFSPARRQIFTLIELLVSTVISSLHFLTQKTAIETKQRIPLFFESERRRGGKGKLSFPVKRKFSLSTAHSFTLIELLVVIAIIAILAAILLPALNSARERGRAASCISNQKQIASAFNMYNNSFDDYFPHYYKAGYGNWTRPLLDMGAVETSVFVCSSLAVNGDYAQDYKNSEGMPYPGYGINTYGVGCCYYTKQEEGSARTAMYNKLSLIKNASKLCLVADTRWGNNTTVSGYYRFLNAHMIGASYGNIDPRHNEQLNFALADGHVETLKLKPWPNEFEPHFNNNYLTGL